MIECLDRGHAGQSGAQGAFAHCLCFKQFYGPDGDPDPGFVRRHQHLRHLGAYAYIIVQTSRGPLPSSSAHDRLPWVLHAKEMPTLLQKEA